MSAKRALVCAPIVPEFDRESGSRRVFDTIGFLRELGYSVSFVAQNGKTPGARRYALALQQRGVAVHDGFGPELDELIENGRFDIVLCVFWYIGEALIPRVRELSPASRIIVDSVDLHFLRHARGAYAGSGAIDRALSVEMIRELNTFAAADAVLAVSQKEANLINDISGDPNLAHLLTDNEELPASPIPAAERQGIAFIGNFRHPPNVDAVAYLCHEILPRMDATVLAQHPVYVVGNGLNDTIRSFACDMPNVRMVGWVPSVVPYLERARVAVLPLLGGAGTKRKLLQALMIGTPAVSTSVGTEGFDVRDGEHVLVADDAASFARRVAELIRDDECWLGIAKAGRCFALSHYGRDEVRRQFADVISTISSRDPKSPAEETPVSAMPFTAMRQHEYRRDVTQIRNVVQKAVPENATVLVVSKGDDALLELDGRRAWHFPQGNGGGYAGHYPANDAEAIAHLESLRAKGAGYLLFPRAAFWWLDHFKGFRRYLEQFHLVARYESCLIYGWTG
jgi:glycosyltransferase involved in cell wall biosynthesis